MQLQRQESVVLRVFAFQDVYVDGAKTMDEVLRRV